MAKRKDVQTIEMDWIHNKIYLASATQREVLFCRHRDKTPGLAPLFSCIGPAVIKKERDFFMSNNDVK